MPLNENDRMLITNALKGNFTTVFDLQRAGANVNANCTEEGTALMAASFQGRWDVVQELRRQGTVEVNARKPDGTTALYLASERGHVQVVHELLQMNNVDVNAVKYDGLAALELASEGLSAIETMIDIEHVLDVVSEFVGPQRGDAAVITQCCNAAAMALYIACRNGYVQVLCELLKHYNVNVNAQQNSHATALIKASQHDFAEVVGELLSRDTDVQCPKCTDTSALVAASGNGHLNVVRELFQYYTVVNAVVPNGALDTALYIASVNGYVEVVRELLKHKEVKANLRRSRVCQFLPRSNGDTNLLYYHLSAFVVAAKSNDFPFGVIRELFQTYNAEVNVQGFTGAIALWLACENGHVQVVRELLKIYNVDVNARWENGPTALIKASQYGDAEVIEVLLRNNADVTVDNEGLTALEVARSRRHDDVVRLLENYHLLEFFNSMDPSKEWQEFLQSQSGVGMLTIMVVHQRFSYWLEYLITLVLVTQVMIPVLLFVDYVHNFIIEQQTFCPRSADSISRSVAFAIGCVYQYRAYYLMRSRLSEPPIEVKTEKLFKPLIRCSLRIDRFLNTYFEVLIYVLNLIIVYLTPEPRDMVLNSLSLEFIQQLDDVVKERYIAAYAKNNCVVENYKEAFVLPKNVLQKDPSFFRRVLDYMRKPNWERKSVELTVVGFYLLTIGITVCKPWRDSY
jgi:ankyrin repeat protein